MFLMILNNYLLDVMPQLSDIYTSLFNDNRKPIYRHKTMKTQFTKSTYVINMIKQQQLQYIICELE